MKKQNNHILVIISTILICIFTLLINSACSSHLIDIDSNTIVAAGTQTLPENTNDTPENTPETPAETPENPETPEGTPENPQQPQQPIPQPPQPQQRSYFSLQSDPNGIKLILDDDVTLQENAGSSMNVEGLPIQISNMDWTKKEFVYPFTTQGQTYNVKLSANIIVDDGTPGGNYKWITNTLECVAGGGIDYTQYINPEPLLNMQVDVNYNGSYFIVDCVANTGTIFIDSTPINSPTVEVALLIGKADWSNTRWGGNHLLSIPEEITNSNSSFTVTFTLSNLSDWANHDYKYWASVAPHFYFDGYGDTQFEITPISKTAEKTYNP